MTQILELTEPKKEGLMPPGEQFRRWWKLNDLDALVAKEQQRAEARLAAR